MKIERIEYIADLVAELTKMAWYAGERDLANLLDMARLEAVGIVMTSMSQRTDARPAGHDGRTGGAETAYKLLEN